MRRRVKDGERERESLRGQVDELSAEKIAWNRIEQTLKERIHKLQEEYY